MNDVEKRREHIISRRQQRWTYHRIGQELGVSGTQAARLYRAGMKDRARREAADARATATLDTGMADLGLPGELTAAMIDMGLTDLRSILAMERRAFEAVVLRYPNVGRRALKVLGEIRARFSEPE